MKSSREEVQRVAKESGFHVKTFSRFSEDPQILILTGSGDWDCFDVTDKLERFAAAMYEAGAAAERAVSDRLLEALLHCATADALGICDNGYSAGFVANATIAEVEAMRKENKE